MDRTELQHTNEAANALANAKDPHESDAGSGESTAPAKATTRTRPRIVRTVTSVPTLDSWTPNARVGVSHAIQQYARTNEKTIVAIAEQLPGGGHATVCRWALGVVPLWSAVEPIAVMLSLTPLTVRRLMLADWINEHRDLVEHPIALGAAHPHDVGAAVYALMRKLGITPNEMAVRLEVKPVFIRQLVAQRLRASRDVVARVNDAAGCCIDHRRQPDLIARRYPGPKVFAELHAAFVGRSAQAIVACDARREVGQVRASAQEVIPAKGSPLEGLYDMVRARLVKQFLVNADGIPVTGQDDYVRSAGHEAPGGAAASIIAAYRSDIQVRADDILKQAEEIQRLRTIIGD